MRYAAELITEAEKEAAEKRGWDMAIEAAVQLISGFYGPWDAEASPEQNIKRIRREWSKAIGLLRYPGPAQPEGQRGESK